MSSNTLTVDEFDDIIKDITNDSSADETKLLYNVPFEDNTSKINVTISVQDYEMIYGINDELFTEVLGRFSACKNDDKNKECEYLNKQQSDATKVVSKSFMRWAKGETLKKTISYKNKIRKLINKINSHRMGDLSMPLMLEELFIKYFDKQKYNEYINDSNRRKRDQLDPIPYNMMAYSTNTTGVIYNIFLVLNEMNVADDDLKYISPELKHKFLETENMDQLFKFFKIFNNSAQIYEKIVVGGKRRKTKLKKRRKKRKSQKKRKLKS